MRALLTTFSIILLLGLITGCENGGGGVPEVIIDEQLLGVWQTISVKESDIIQPISTALGWQTGWTKQTIEFKDDGACTRRSYKGSSLVQTEIGTWTAENMAGSHTFGSEKTNFNYVVYWDAGQPWIAVLTFSKDDHTYVVHHVKVVALTAHNKDIIRTWKVTTLDPPNTITVDGEPVTATEFFNLGADSIALTFQFRDDGTFTTRELVSNTVVDRQFGSWSTGGNTIYTSQEGVIKRGYLDSGGWSYVYLDETTGKTVRVNWSAWAPLGDRLVDLVGKWQPTGLTQDGVPVSIASYFDWEPGVTSQTWELWADGTSERRNYTGTNLTSAKLGTWVVSGPYMSIYLNPPYIGNYAINGNTFTLTISLTQNVYIITYAKQN